MKTRQNKNKTEWKQDRMKTRQNENKTEWKQDRMKTRQNENKTRNQQVALSAGCNYIMYIKNEDEV